MSAIHTLSKQWQDMYSPEEIFMRSALLTADNTVWRWRTSNCDTV